MSAANIEQLLQTPAFDAFGLTAVEDRLIEIWNQLQDLELEHAIVSTDIHAPDEDLHSRSSEYLQQQIEEAETALLESRASYALRNKVINNVLAADPILKAVHESGNASPLERRMRPLVHERDVLSMYQAYLSDQLRRLQTRLYQLEVDIISQNQRNKVLTREMLELAERTKVDINAGEVDDPRLSAQMQAVDAEVKAARKKYSVMKGVVRGVVAGSGIDWVREDDGKWQAVVLDGDDEGA